MDSRTKLANDFNCFVFIRDYSLTPWLCWNCVFQNLRITLSNVENALHRAKNDSSYSFSGIGATNWFLTILSLPLVTVPVTDRFNLLCYSFTLRKWAIYVFQSVSDSNVSKNSACFQCNDRIAYFSGNLFAAKFYGLFNHAIFAREEIKRKYAIQKRL